MKKIIYTIFFLLSGTFAIAQKSKAKDPTLVDNIAVQLDGQLHEWEGKLTSIDTDTSWSYAASNDEEYIYLAVKIRQQSLVQEAARNGIKISVNPKAKKKGGAMLFFPSADAESKRALSNADNVAEMNIPKELIKRSRGYLLKNFAHIVDGQLSFENTYGVAAKAAIDDQNHLIYESRIPIAAIGINDLDQPVAIGIEIITRFSQLQTALSSHARQVGNRYGRQPARVKSPYKMKTEIWIVDILNKN